MSRFERPHGKHIDSLDEPQRDAAAAPPGSSTEAEGSAAHIAELVRRTTERHAAPSPSVAARSEVLGESPPTSSSASLAPTAEQPAVRIDSPPAAHQGASPEAVPARQMTRHPSPRILVAASIVVALLVGGAVAASQLFGSKAAQAPDATLTASTPAGYSVSLSDVITDCASHARGRTKDSFETQNCVKATRSVATGTVGGRPVLFVASRIEMASADAAASVKQVLDGNGTGNVDDLLREGKTFAGAPKKMPRSGYTSVQTGKVVTVAEAGFVDGGRSAGTDPALRAAASQVAAMVSAQG